MPYLRLKEEQLRELLEMVIEDLSASPLPKAQIITAAIGFAEGLSAANPPGGAVCRQPTPEEVK